MQALPEEKQVTEKKETERRIENKSFNKNTSHWYNIDPFVLLYV